MEEECWHKCWISRNVCVCVSEDFKTDVINLFTVRMIWNWMNAQHMIFHLLSDIIRLISTNFRLKRTIFALLCTWNLILFYLEFDLKSKLFGLNDNKRMKWSVSHFQFVFSFTIEVASFCVEIQGNISLKYEQMQQIHCSFQTIE